MVEMLRSLEREVMWFSYLRMRCLGPLRVENVVFIFDNKMLRSLEREEMWFCLLHCAHLEMEREVGAREGEGELAGLEIGNQGTLSSGKL